MRAKQWLTVVDVRKMLAHIDSKISNRKLRLFAVGCCRRLPPIQRNKAARNAVDIAERYADGKATKRQLHKVHLAAVQACDYAPENGLEDYRSEQAILGAVNASSESASQLIYVAECAAYGSDDEKRENAAQCELLRDIIGNPFGSMTIMPSVRTSLVRKMAKGIYEDHAFDRLPILADALEEAGCTNETILSHCRGPGPHVRGCWVVDLLLGKE